MRKKPSGQYYKGSFPPFLIFVFIFFIIIGLILFSSFGIIALIAAGVLALVTSVIRFLFPSRFKRFDNYNPRTKTLTLQEKDYEIIDDDD